MGGGNVNGLPLADLVVEDVVARKVVKKRAPGENGLMTDRDFFFWLVQGVPVPGLWFPRSGLQALNQARRPMAGSVRLPVAGWRVFALRSCKLVPHVLCAAQEIRGTN